MSTRRRCACPRRRRPTDRDRMAASQGTPGPADAEARRRPVSGSQDRPRAPGSVKRRTRSLFGLRVRPGRLALAVFRLPVALYRRGWGSLLGHTFLLLVHVGRKSGTIYSSVAMALTYDRATKEAVICSVWGSVRTGCATSEFVLRSKSGSAGSRSPPSSASSPRTNASMWPSSFDPATHGGCGCSRSPSAGATCAQTPP
jgi:hypothetical protein